MSNEEEKCPLCAEEMDWTDKQLKPCTCGYEVCVWCWHHIMEVAEKDEIEGRCPACRTPYDKEKIVGVQANCKRMDGTKKGRENKQQKSKTKRNEGRKDLSGVRVIQRKIAYIIGLPHSLADEDILQQKDYFGQYGKVSKVCLSRMAGGSLQHFVNSTCCVYVTYSKEEEAIRCIKTVHGFILEGSFLRASFGTAKYCYAWLRNMPCTNPTCLFLHSIGAEEDSFSKEEEAAVHTRDRVDQIVGATQNLQRRSGTMLPPPLDESIPRISIATDKPFDASAQKDVADATLKSSGHLTCLRSSKDKDGLVEKPSKSGLDVVRQSSSSPEKGNDAEDRKIVNLCSEFSSFAVDKDPVEARHSSAVPGNILSFGHLPVAVPGAKDSPQYSVEPIRETLSFSVVGRSDFTHSDTCYTKAQSGLISDSERQLLPGARSDGREDLLPFDDRRLCSNSLFQGSSVLPSSNPITISDHFHGLARQCKETCSLSDFNADRNTIHDHVDQTSVPFTSVNSDSINRYNGSKFQSTTKSYGSSRFFNSFSNEEIVEQLRRLGDDTNDDDGYAFEAVESSIVSNILSMDFDSCDDSLTLPLSSNELSDETDRLYGSCWNLRNREQSWISLANDIPLIQTTDFYSSFSNVGQVSKKYSFLPGPIVKDEHYVGGPRHNVSRGQRLIPTGFSVPNREPHPGFPLHEKTNHVLSATSGSHLVKSSSLRSNHCGVSSPGIIDSTRSSNIFYPAQFFVSEGKTTNGLNIYEDEARLWHLQQQSAPAHQDPKFCPLFTQETPFAHQELNFSGCTGDGFSILGDTFVIPKRVINQQQTYNPSTYTQLPQQNGNGLTASGYLPGLDEIWLRNERGTAEIQRNERLGFNNLFPGHGDLMSQMPSTGGLCSGVYGL